MKPLWRYTARNNQYKNMTTKLALWVLGAVLVAGGGYYYVSHRSSMPEAGTVSQGATASSTGEAGAQQGGAFSGSIADLSARGGDWSCVIKAQSDTGSAQAGTVGTVYVSGHNVRGDFSTNAPGYGVVESHMIADGTNVYTWSSAMPFGIKTAMTASSQSGSQATSGQGASANQSYAYDCTPAQSDASLYAPPANVTFRSY